MPPSDPERERTQIARLRALAEEAQLDPAFAEKWFNFVVAEVIHHHERMAEPQARGALARAPPFAAEPVRGSPDLVARGRVGCRQMPEAMDIYRQLTSRRSTRPSVCPYD